MKTALPPQALGHPRNDASLDRLIRKGFSVLVADDSINDHFFTKRGISQSCCLKQVGAVADGREVKDYLAGCRGAFKLSLFRAIKVSHPINTGEC